MEALLRFSHVSPKEPSHLNDRPQDRSDIKNLLHPVMAQGSPEPSLGHTASSAMARELLQPQVLSLGPHPSAVLGFFIPGLTVLFSPSGYLLIPIPLPGKLSPAHLPPPRAPP